VSIATAAPFLLTPITASALNHAACRALITLDPSAISTALIGDQIFTILTIIIITISNK
jgi:hypothetical protein